PAAGRTGTAGRTEQVTQVEADAARPARRAEPAGATRAEPHPAAGPEQRPGLVVLLPGLLVGQDVVRLGDLLEALLGRAVALVRVRVVRARQLAVRLLDVGGRRVLGDAQDLVEVLLQVVLRRQRLLLVRLGHTHSRRAHHATGVRVAGLVDGDA